MLRWAVRNEHDKRVMFAIAAISNSALAAVKPQLVAVVVEILMVLLLHEIGDFWNVRDVHGFTYEIIIIYSLLRCDVRTICKGDVVLAEKPPLLLLGEFGPFIIAVGARIAQVT